MAKIVTCTEWGCRKDVALDELRVRCPECDFPYCAEHIQNHECDGLLLAPEIDLLDEWAF